MIPNFLRTILFAVCLICATSVSSLIAGEPDSLPAAHRGLHWFPDRPIFPHLDADGTAPRLSLSKDLDSRRIVGSIGGLQRLVETTLGEVPVQLGVGATVYGNFIRMPDVLDVVTVDFFVDIPLDFQVSDNLVVRTGWGHYSAHLADDGIETLGGHSINYAKDYVPLLAALTVAPIGGFVYGGFRFDYYSIPAIGKNWVLQAGAEFGNIPVLGSASLYGAVDLKSRQEAAWGTVQSYQVGLRMLSFGPRAVRFAYTYRTGLDERGQFYTQRLSSSLLGVFLDF